MFEAQQGAEDIHLEHRADVGRLHIDHQRGDLDPRIVDEHVKAAKRIDRGSDGRLPARLVGDIEVDVARRATAGLDALCDELTKVVLNIRHDHRGARVGKGLGHALPEALRTAGDQRLAPAQSEP